MSSQLLRDILGHRHPRFKSKDIHDHSYRYEWYTRHSDPVPTFIAHSLADLQGVTGILVSDLKRRANIPFPKGRIVVDWFIRDMKPDQKHNLYQGDCNAVRFSKPRASFHQCTQWTSSHHPPFRCRF